MYCKMNKIICNKQATRERKEKILLFNQNVLYNTDKLSIYRLFML